MAFDKILQKKSATLVDKTEKYNGLDEKQIIYCQHPLHASFIYTPRDIIYSNAWCAQCKDELRKIKRFKKLREEFIEFLKKDTKNEIALIANPLEPYLDPYYSYQWVCKNNHIHTMNFLKMRELYERNKNTDSWCLKCKNEVRTETNISSFIKIVEENYDLFSVGINSSEEEEDEEEDDTKFIEYQFECDEKHPFILNVHQIKYAAKSIKKRSLCPVCNKYKKLDMANTLIKELYVDGVLLDAKFSNTTDKHNWSCGVDNHPSFEQSYEKLQLNGLSSGCQSCTPRKNKKRTSTDKITFAQMQNSKYTIPKGTAELLNDQTNSNSRSTDVWRCSNKDHKPFFGSIDNMRRRDQWCPYCTGRNPKKIPILEVDY